MKCIVTGGAGFIGSHLAEALLARGDEVHIIDDLSTGHRGNVPAGAQLHQGSITDRELLARVFAGAKYVFHEAALGSVPRSIEEPARTDFANVHGTVCVLDAARHANVEKVVFAASSSAYGDTPTLPKHEEMAPSPKSPYAVTKLAGEQYCRTFYETYGLRTTALRYFNVYGPRQDPQGAYAAVIPRWIAACLGGEPIVIHGDGSQSRDFTYVDDVVQANLLATASTAADGEIVNIGAGSRTDLSTLAKLILDATGSDARVEHAPPRAGDVAHSLASLEKAKRVLAYEPRVTLREGLAATAASMRRPAGK